MHTRDVTSGQPYAVMVKPLLLPGFLLENNVREDVVNNSCCNLDQKHFAIDDDAFEATWWWRQKA